MSRTVKNALSQQGDLYESQELSRTVKNVINVEVGVSNHHFDDLWVTPGPRSPEPARNDKDRQWITVKNSQELSRMPSPEA